MAALESPKAEFGLSDRSVTAKKKRFHGKFLNGNQKIWLTVEERQ